jgi:SAM-dependent methyltransferase
MDIQKINRPSPIIEELEVFELEENLQEAVEALLQGNDVLVTDYFSRGLALLKELKTYLQFQFSEGNFQKQRDFRSVYQKYSNHILLPISEHKLAVGKAPEIGWLKILYPDLREFALPFPKVQGLNSAWQWYVKGLKTPFLKEKIFPYYGVYFPTRFDHLLLFDRWLKRYKGDNTLAYDVGIGSGILSFMMLKYGFRHIVGTDNNPNAIKSVEEAKKRNRHYHKIELLEGNLFCGDMRKADLIVFNPPWIPAQYNTQALDAAIYYDENLFPGFFAEAQRNLKPDGKLIILFSNLAKITHSSKIHPIQEEVSTGGRFVKEKVFKLSVGKPSSKTKRTQSWRAKEVVELWQLTLK